MHRSCCECRIITVGDSCLPVCVTAQCNHRITTLLSAPYLTSINNYQTYCHLALHNTMLVILYSWWEVLLGIWRLPERCSQFGLRKIFELASNEVNTGNMNAFSSSKRGKKAREKSCLFSIRVHTVLLQTERMLAKQAYSRGFCVDCVSSANPAPQTCFKESSYLYRALMWVLIMQRSVRTRDAVQV